MEKEREMELRLAMHGGFLVAQGVVRGSSARTSTGKKRGRGCSKSLDGTRPRLASASLCISPNTSKQKSGVGLHGGRPESGAGDGVVKQVRERERLP
jgi:hypothetical protein